MTYDKICALLEELKFRGMAGILEEVLKRTEKDGTSARDTLYELLAEELRYRRERSLIYRMEQAKIPWDWTLSSFPFEKQAAVQKSRIMDLADARFVERGENIVFIGDTGTGKSGLASGLLREAILSGKKGLFYNVQDRLDDLYASLADRTTSKMLGKLCRFDLLVLDELGYLTLTPEQMNAFFKLMAERYQASKSTIITTNLNYPKWYDLFEPKDMVDALLDRLRHHCVTIRIKGKSLRKQ
ncbi:MAG: ATP-binding protein [Desulfobacteraceae bacterium]|nr:ATP-binding protein [Desulfobacteraceae bacterium]